MLLLISVLIGMMLSLYPSWRLIAVINAAIFAAALLANVGRDGELLFALIFAVANLFVISICFVVSSLIIDAINNGKTDKKFAELYSTTKPR